MSRTILDCIGNTPLVEIRRLNPNPRVRILAKLEYFNPGGSIKDRTAMSMITAAEASGELTPSKTVLEATSGNTGIGLALVCAVKGYRLLLAMSEAVSLERRKILKARGAEILLTPGRLGTDGAIEEVYRLAREDPERYYLTDQYNNPANWEAHYSGTAEEIWRQTGGRITHVVATMGTTGTLMGLSRRFKERDYGIQVIGVEPYLGHKIQGLKNLKEAYCPEIFEKHRLDGKVNIDDAEAFEMARRLAREEGLFVGMSSGAAIVVACQTARQLSSGVVVAILPDSGERYLSTPLFDVREKIDLHLFNTPARAKAPFAAAAAGRATLFTCGPTVHDRMHLSECRRLVFADLLHRYLEYRGYAVKHVMNIVDVEDKTIQGSEKSGRPLKEFTDQQIEGVLQDLEFLGIRRLEAYPRASEHIDEMLQLAGRLAQKGFAYEKLRSLYFDVSRYAEYGRLSGMDLDKIKLGATVDLDEYEKDNPRDFTLLKRSKLAELKRGIYYKTEWGNVRPSYHLQAVAIAAKYLGVHFDVYASSRDLIFPHHENEIAIAAAAFGQPLARYWMLSEPVLADGKKIDDKNNRLTLKTLRDKGFSGAEIRFWLLSQQYRKPLTLADPRLIDARRTLKRLNTFLFALQQIQEGQPCAELDQILYDLKNGFIRGMDDDLNISRAMAAVFKVVKKVNALIQTKCIDAAGAQRILEVLQGINTVLNVCTFAEATADPQIQTLLAKRAAARRARDWDLADRLREQLSALGFTVQDTKA